MDVAIVLLVNYLMKLLVVLLILSVWSLNAETKINKFLNWSKVALIAGNSFDAESSYGKSELNPLLANSTGKFNTKGIAIKAGVVAGILFTETYLCKREEKAKKPLMFLNFGIGAVTTGVAVRNWKNK